MFFARWSDFHVPSCVEHKMYTCLPETSRKYCILRQACKRLDLSMESGGVRCGELLDAEPRDGSLAARVPQWTDVDPLAAWLELMLAISPVGQLDASIPLFPASALLNQWNTDSYGHGVTASLLGRMHCHADVCWAIPHQTSSIIHRLKWKPVSDQKHFSLSMHQGGGWVEHPVPALRGLIKPSVVSATSELSHLNTGPVLSYLAMVSLFT